jgi:RNA polymerase sigma factor (sigma-70 family)
MPNRVMRTVIQHLRNAARFQNEAGETDGQLLSRFIECRDEAAFAALVYRHGRMVMGVCRRLIHNHQDSEDAFQVVFLVLCRKASSIRPREMVANWLHGVAHQTALQARRTAARRCGRERQVTELPEPATTEQDLCRELQPLLDKELSRLSDKYRAAIVLCDLEGKTRKEAARQLGVPEGTVAGRLARARTMLAKRLRRHGFAVSGGALAVVMAQSAASAYVPTSIVTSTIKAAAMLAAGPVAAGAISGKVFALLEGVLKTMFLNKLKRVTVVLLMILFGVGSGVLIAKGVADEKKPEPPAVNAPEKGVVQTTILEFTGAHNANDAAADERFLNKQVEIAGKFGGVSRVSIDRNPSVYIMTMADNRGMVWFQFDEKDRKQLAALKRGQELIIRGKCEGRTGINANGKPEEAILLSNCEIVEAKPPADEGGGRKSNGFEREP